MGEQVKKNRRPTLRFNESEIKLALDVMDQLEKPIELMYYLMSHENEKSFVIMLVSAEGSDVGELLKGQKRDTDLLFPIYGVEGSNTLFALICQETKVDGGYRFAERILRTLVSKDANNVYCIEIEVRSTRYDKREVIFKAIESYISTKKSGNSGEIVFRSLN